MKGSLGAVIKLLPCNHEVMGSKVMENPLVEMQGKNAYLRSKVVGPFPDPAQAGATCTGLLNNDIACSRCCEIRINH
jgi:hypothetical protein